MPNQGFDIQTGQYPRSHVDFGLCHQIRSYKYTFKGVIGNENETTHLVQKQKGNKCLGAEAYMQWEAQ